MMVTIKGESRSFSDDETETENYSHKKNKRFDRREKNHRKNVHKKALLLGRHTMVFEFGYRLDLSFNGDLQLYMSGLENWLSTFRLPRTFKAFRDFTRCYLRDKEYRRVGLLLLAQRSNWKAKCILNVHRGAWDELMYLSQKRNIENGEGHVIYEVFGTMDKENKTHLSEELLVPHGLFSDVLSGKIFSDISAARATGDAVGPLVSVVAGISDMCLTVWNWFKKAYKEIVDALEAQGEWLHPLFIRLIGVLVICLALEFAYQMFKKGFKAIKDFLFSKFKVEDTEIEYYSVKTTTAQYVTPDIVPHGIEETGESYNVLTSILDFIRRNFTKLEKSYFFEMLGKLPKIVTVAKAVKWIFDNLEYLWGFLVETWTGEPRGQNAREIGILKFSADVAAMESLLKTGDTADVFSIEVAGKMDALLLEGKRLNEVVRTSASTRPYFTTMLGITHTKFQQLNIMLRIKKKAAMKRPVPVWLALRGAPGIGKTKVMEDLMAGIWLYIKSYSTILSAEGDMSYAHTFSMNQKEEFYDGYNGQFFFLIDDLFQLLDPETRASVASALIGMVSPTPYTLRVAQVEDKAHCHFTSRCIISTTNITTSSFDNQNVGLVSPRALESRRTVSVVMRPEGDFVLDSACSIYLGPRKLPELPDGRKIITLDDLIALVGEAIIYRDAEVHHNAVARPVPRFDGSFSGGRLTLTSTIGKCSEGEPLVAHGKDKGKEKEEFGGYAEEFTPEKGWTPLVSKKRSFSLIPCPNPVRGWGFPYVVPHYKHLKSQSAFIVGDENVVLDNLLLPDSALINNMPGSLLRLLMNLCPQRIMLRPSNGYIRVCTRLSHERALTLDEEFALYLDSHHSSHADLFFPGFKAVDYTVWDPLIEEFGSTMLAWPDQKKLDLLKKVRSRRSLVSTLAIHLSVFAGLALLFGTVFKFCMPKSAYKPKLVPHAPYEHKVKPTKAQMRRAGKRAKASKAKEIISAMPHNGNQTDRLINNSLEPFQVAQAPLGASWQSITTPLTEGWMIYIGGVLAIAPRHSIFKNADPSYETWLLTGSNCRGVRGYWKMSELKTHDLRGDLLLIVFPSSGFNARKSIFGLIASEFPAKGKIDHLMPENESGMLSKTCTSYVETVIANITVSRDYGTYETDFRVHGMPCYPGMCCTPYIHRPTGKIIGLHMAGNQRGDVGYGVSLLQSDLKKYIDRYNLYSQEPRDPITYPLEDGRKIPGTISHGILEPHCASFVPKESKIVRTTFDIEGFPIPETSDGPAHLSPVDGNSPLNIAIHQFGLHARVPPPRSGLSMHDILPKSFCPQNVHSVTIEEAVFGIPGYMKGIDVSTSAGYFWKRKGKTRKQLINLDTHWIDPELRRDVESYMQDIRAGIPRYAVYEGTLKDEVRSEAKNKAYKTRLFASGDLTSLICHKMVLGTFAVEFMKDPVESPVGLGMNPHSSDWGRLRNRLDAHGNKRIVAGDIEHYDLGVKVEAQDEFIELINQFHPEPLAVRAVVHSSISGYQIIGRLVFQRPWGTSSGCFITAMFNTFNNYRMHKHAWVDLYGEDTWKAFESSFTGDDSLGTSPKNYEKFNMLYLQTYFREMFNVNYTSPFKTADMADIDWDSVIYLKRRFELGHAGWMAPLEKRSIANMVKWSDSEQTPEYIQSVLEAVLLEGWHYGEVFYNELYTWCLRESRRLGSFRVLTWKQMERARSVDYLV